ncbi:MAG: hypothetical protein U0894_07585 [Pirellulales bacterium]
MAKLAEREHHRKVRRNGTELLGVGSTPVVFNDLLLVMVGGSGKGAKNYTAAQLDLHKETVAALLRSTK